jgi:hypothetical protein
VFGLGEAPRSQRSYPAGRIRFVTVLDVLTAIALLAAMVSFVVGGFVLELSIVTLSVRSWFRALTLGLVLPAIRHQLVPYPFVGGAVPLRDRLPLDEAALFERGPGGSWRRIGGLLLLTAAFALLVGISTWPQVAELYRISDKGDPLFSIWRMSWLSHEFLRHPLNIFNGNQFYPEPRTMTYSDPVLYPALLFAPLTWMGVHRVAAYNLVLLSGGVISGVTLYFLVRSLTGRKDAALVSGAIFATYPFRVEHLAHLELQMTIWMPLALLWLHRAMASGRLRDGLMAGLVFGLQMISALYYGAFLMPLLVTLGVALWIGRNFPAPPLKTLAAGALLALIVIAPVGLVYLKTKPYMGPRPVYDVQHYSATGRDYLHADHRSWTYHRLSRNHRVEMANFPRLVPLVLTAVALWPPLSIARIGYTLCLAVAFDASLGYNGRIFPVLYEYVPPFSGIRVPSRFGIVVGMVLAILSGYGAARLFRRWPRARPFLAATVMATIVFESLPRMTLEDVWLEPPPVYAPLIGKPASVLAEFPMPVTEAHYNAEFNYLYFSTFHWHKLVNGQSGWLPPTYQELLRQQASFPSDAAVDYLRSRDVEYITVHGAFYEPDEYSRIVTQLDARPDVELLTIAPWEGAESRLYQLRNRRSAEPFEAGRD